MVEVTEDGESQRAPVKAVSLCCCHNISKPLILALSSCLRWCARASADGESQSVGFMYNAFISRELLVLALNLELGTNYTAPLVATANPTKIVVLKNTHIFPKTPPTLPPLHFEGLYRFSCVFQ